MVVTQRFIVKMVMGTSLVTLLGIICKFVPNFYNWFLIISSLVLIVILFLANYNEDLAPVFSFLFLAGLIGVILSTF